MGSCDHVVGFSIDPLNKEYNFVRLSLLVFPYRWFKFCPLCGTFLPGAEEFNSLLEFRKSLGGENISDIEWYDGGVIE